jgi:hypothetical protein
MRKEVIFIQVTPLRVNEGGDYLLVALDTNGRVWTKMLFGNLVWSPEPTPTETVN